MSSTEAVNADCELPAVDERLVAPNERYEIDEGVLVYVPPADEPHGTRHSKVSALVEAHAGADFEVACDMLTRTSRISDIAPDVSVFPRARDPSTGGRQLEQLAFEVVSTESLGHAGRRATQLVLRGVRRVFAIDVERRRAHEWSRSQGGWEALEPNADIEDPALAVPLPVQALVNTAKSDDAVARALLVKRNPVIEAARAQDRAEGLFTGMHLGRSEGRAEGQCEGKVEGKIEALLAVLAARGFAPQGADRARIAVERDPARLDRWIAKAATCADIAELFAVS